MYRQSQTRTRSKQCASRRRARFAARMCRFELLEPRLALSVDASPFAPVTWTTQANGLPILTSFATAPAMVFLDYDGDGTTSELDLDHTPGVFSTFEQQRIVEHCADLSAVYSMFNVGVTTIQPNTATVPTEWIAITNDMLNKGGVNGVGTFPDTMRHPAFPEATGGLKVTHMKSRMDSATGISRRMTCWETRRPNMARRPLMTPCMVRSWVRAAALLLNGFTVTPASTGKRFKQMSI